MGTPAAALQRLERDQVGDLGDRRAQQLFQPELQRGELGGVDCARSQQPDSHRSINVDAQELDVAAICDQDGAEGVEVRLDGVPQRVSACGLQRQQKGIGIFRTPL